MPDSPANLPSDVPPISSPGHLRIPSSASQLLDVRTPISIATSLPNGYHHHHHPASPNQPLSPGLLNGMQLPHTCATRQLSKLKRFLTTLQQFGSDISPEIGERVRGLIVNLINSGISVEEFHQQLQDATNFPLRPFVIPFLKTNLPLLQQELLSCTHLSKRSPPPHSYTGSPPESERERERIKKEAEEVLFERVGEKRKMDHESRSKENGHHLDSFGLPSPNKKKHFTSPGYERNEERNPMVDQLLENYKQDTEDWRNIETILQCIVTFVDNAKRSVAAIQERCIRDREEMASWARAITADAENEIKRRANELVTKALKQTDDRVNEVKKRAEEAVSDVKRQAVVELKKAVNAAEEKANDALSLANQRMDQAVQEARRKATEETSSIINLQDASKENCWNCGRKANETCSGCNHARYCGSFCQHKDWDTHQKDCPKLKPQPSSQPLQPQQQQQQQQQQQIREPPVRSKSPLVIERVQDQQTVTSSDERNSPVNGVKPAPLPTEVPAVTQPVSQPVVANEAV